MNSGAAVNTERVKDAARKEEQERSMEWKEEGIERDRIYKKKR